MGRCVVLTPVSSIYKARQRESLWIQKLRVCLLPPATVSQFLALSDPCEQPVRVYVHTVHCTRKPAPHVDQPYAVSNNPRNIVAVICYKFSRRVLADRCPGRRKHPVCVRREVARGPWQIGRNPGRELGHPSPIGKLDVRPAFPLEPVRRNKISE